MRTIRRTMVASALALPLMIGAAGIASADSFGSTQVQAGPDGVASHSVQADTHRGSSSFHEHSSAAGPDGVASQHKSASADRDGGSKYQEHSGWAGQDGAGSSETHSSTDGGHDQGVLSGVLGL
ncbi:hypothetical protein ACFQ05_08010 [Amycolatopsis umgeniensis]|uniref:Uncharacterized protein n=1 Tax=Amycolatopsis umgeniensis TaxID=336628 RepID=A0A841AWF5_9PSEU|nr:hypothetical protein [Amycolatopsis umgeniensis]MBB5853229.1 hypothetical protein [Amycolatopsis umgeniensis]